ncbi:MAG: hypothetical protein FWE98_06765 [Oscillospiraceae bacterium]|nr:hypothetical protein [Oscillospiraceae bacterium]
MKKTLKRGLALLLAILLTLGVSAVASAAAPAAPMKAPELTAAAVDLAALPPCVLEITTQPTDTTFVMYEEQPNLAGLVITASGGGLDAPAVVDYDAAITDRTPAKDKFVWDFYVQRNYDVGWVVGDNQAMLYVWGYQWTTFHPEKEIDGVWYGTFDQEEVFFWYTAITVKAIARTTSMENALVLALDTPAKLELLPYVTWADGSVSCEAYQWYKFTAPQDGYYIFRSDGAERGRTLYSEDGEAYRVNTIDPWAYLCDKDGNWLDDDDDSYGNYNFAIYRQMKANELVYLYVGAYSGEEATIDVVVSRLGDTQPVLKLKGNEVRAVYHEHIDFSGLLEDEDQDWWYISKYDSSCLRYGVYGIKRGVTYVTLATQDGRSAQVKVTIEYSLSQWLCVIFLGGFIWLPYTSYGTFNLFWEIGNLLGYGVGNALIELFADWLYQLRYLLLGLRRW